VERKLTISEARARLPELARRVVRDPGAVEYIAHRDLPDDLALTSARHLRSLEKTIEDLRRRLNMKPFKLAGSLASELDDEALESILAEIRTEADESARRKVEELGQ
jgi:Ni,Fe-hydrogenase maturation factor